MFSHGQGFAVADVLFAQVWQNLAGSSISSVMNQFSTKDIIEITPRSSCSGRFLGDFENSIDSDLKDCEIVI